MRNASLTTIIRVIFISLVVSHSAYAGVGGFYKQENKYRGFYWFEDQKRQERNLNPTEFHFPTAEESTSAIEARKKSLDDARSQMVELGFRKDVPPRMLRRAIVKYKKLEAEMSDGAIALVHASEMANFTNPEIANVRELPTNVFANKIKRKADEEQKIATVREFAKNFNLLLFVEEGCPYCKVFMPVITNFAKEHGFALDVTSLSSKEGKIAQNLGISSVPTLIAISKDSKELFEISRGFSSMSELEASILLASAYSEEQSQKTNNGNKINKNKR